MKLMRNARDRHVQLKNEPAQQGFTLLEAAMSLVILMVIAMGIAFAVQEITSVPATERDARLDFVLTEREVIDFRETK